MSANRRLAAILAADVVGYSRADGGGRGGDAGGAEGAAEGVLEPVVKAHGGRIVKMMGDGVLVEFG